MGRHDNDRAGGIWAGMTMTEQRNEDSGSEDYAKCR